MISQFGDDHRSRVGLSQLSAVGLKWLAEGSDQQYVELAVELGNDSQRVTDLRKGLRDQFRQSSLMNPAKFTKDLESSLIQLVSKADNTWKVTLNDGKST